MSEQNQIQEDEAVEAPPLLSSPVIRITIVVVLLLVAVVCVGFIVLNAQVAARQQPIEVEMYPGASLAAQRSMGPGRDELLYTSDDDAEEVADFYRERYDRSDDDKCVRVNNDVNSEGPAFEVVCNVDHSIVNARQSAIITIQPNVSTEYAGQTVIYIERAWQQ